MAELITVQIPYSFVVIYKTLKLRFLRFHSLKNCSYCSIKAAIPNQVLKVLMTPGATAKIVAT